MGNPIKKRGGHRAQVKKLVDNITNELTEPSPSLEVLSHLQSELNRQKLFILHLDEIILDTLQDDDDIQKDISEASNIIMNIEVTLRNLVKYTEKDSCDKTMNVRLPNLTLPRFNGDPLTWSKFWDLYRTSIHTRSDISAPAKFQYLVSQLDGDAANLLSGFNQTENEYFEAVNLLQNTYGRPQLLVQNRLGALFDLKSPTPTAAGLSEFRSAYEGHLRALKSLNCDIDNAGYVYAELLLRKLPQKSKDNITRAHTKKTWDLADLREAISNEIHHLQSLDENKDLYNSNFNPISSFNASVKNNSPKSCNFCNKNHSIFSCSEFDTVEKKANQCKTLKLCFNCLRKNHSSFQCTNTGRCRHCGRKHHSLLCRGQTSNNKHQISSVETIVSNTHGKEEKKSTDKKVSSNSNNSSDSTSMAALNSNKDSKGNILPTAIMKIVNDENSLQCRALFDSGSQRTFVLKSIIETLKIKPFKTATLSVDGFNSYGPSKEYNIVNLDIYTPYEIISIEAIIVDSMPTRLTMAGRDQIIGSLNNKGIVLADPMKSDDFKLSIILGVDNIFKFIDAPKIHDSIYCMPSKLGMILSGNVLTNETVTVTSVLKIAVSPEESSLDNLMQNMWLLDKVGISEPSLDNDPAVLKFKQSLRYNNGKYTAALPWKAAHPFLPDNKFLSIKRLNSLIASLSSKGDSLKHYNDVIKEQLNLGFIEEVTDTSNDSLKMIHYLPHHGVAKNSITTPIRVVFDCSARQGNNYPSLNDCLLTGPDMLNDLTSILLRFRLYKFASTADIAKAFLNVQLNESDRDCCRFFWPDNPFDLNSKLKIYRFKVVLFGSTASQFLLNSTISHHLEKFNTETSRAIARNIYVDDVHFTCTEEYKLIKFHEESYKIMKEGGFLLREWKSNSIKLNTVVGEKMDGVSSCKSFNSKTKVLGISWDINSDCFSIGGISNSLNSDELTKRSIVSQIAKIFDPMGFLLPVTVKGKILVQNLWRKEISWDQPLLPDVTSEWNNFVSDLISIMNFKIDRKIHSFCHPNLHVFADASSKALGAIAYLVENNKVSYIISKSRLAPINSPSLPQLELTALEFAANLAKFVVSSYSREIVIGETYLWTDSEIVICWLNKAPSKKPFVTHRVNKIKCLCPSAIISHVKSSQNPSDLLTRGIKAKEFLSSELWWFGPEWLKSESFPQAKVSLNIEVSDNVQKETSTSYKFFFPVEKYSSYNKCIRVFSYVLKFINVLKTNTSVIQVSGTCGGSFLTAVEFMQAENILLKLTQKEHFPQIIYYLQDSVGKKPPLVDQLKLCIKNNLICCAGRLSNSDLPEITKFPILLPTNAYISKLIIINIHSQNFHTGVSATLTCLRERYWIPRGRQIVGRALRSCVKCLKVTGKSFPTPLFADLPHDRISKAKPFQITGIDYSGAIKVKGSEDKAYILLFTCAVTRALHLELVASMSEEELINAFKRFCARRSIPQILYSDNAASFKSTNITLNSILEQTKLRNYLAINHIEWRFITPRAPWHGGFWERMVGLCKNLLKKTIGKAFLSFQELSTIIIEVESILNDRPLTYVCDDFTAPLPLSPSELLYGYRIRQLPDLLSAEELSDPSYGTRVNITKRQQYCSLLLNQFWERFCKEYLTSLRERKSNINKYSDIKLGSVVIIEGENLAVRSTWKLGTIVKLIYGNDSIVRSVKLKTSSGYLVRPICKLYPLEIESDFYIDKTLPVEKLESIAATRTKRQAALDAINKIKMSSGN